LIERISAPTVPGLPVDQQVAVIVLDVDDSHLFLKWMQENHPSQALPRTLTIKTGGHGERFHYYFQYPSGDEQYSCRSVKGVFDIRGMGGQVLCPGSLHPETRKPYTIVDIVPIAAAPFWLLEMSKKPLCQRQLKSDPPWVCFGKLELTHQP